MKRIWSRQTLNLKSVKMKINKHSFKSLIMENSYFFGSYLLLLIAGAIVLMLINKGDAVIFFNDWRGSFWDSVFIFLSGVGEGLYFSILLLIIGVFSFRYIVLGVSAYLASGAVTQILKNIFKIQRPKVFFSDTDLVTYVADFRMLSSNSFPSGHTTSGFAIFLFLALISKNKQIGMVFLFCALLVGLSRVYLVQHFLVDIYFGSLVGVFFTLLIYKLLENSQKFSQSNWYNFSLYNYLKGKW
jgi:membrane-associated phospholipid phosphatase